MSKTYKMYLVLGDWSDDGHGKSDKLLIESSHPVKDVQDAYKKSCELTGVSFNHNTDFTKDNKGIRVCTEYEDSKFNEEAKDVLEEYGCPKELMDLEYMDDDTLPELITWFIGISLPDWKFKFVFVNDTIPVINGYWNRNLNVQFGYGLYY